MSSQKSSRLLRSASFTATGALALVVPLIPTAASSAEIVRDRQPVHSFITGKAMAGTSSTLWRIDDEDGDVEERLATRVRTKGKAGHALTLWYVVFNHPEKCNTEGCGEDDIFVDGDPANGPDLDQIAAAGISVVGAGRGDVVRPRGRILLKGGLAEGHVPTGKGRVVIGQLDHGALIESPVTGVHDVEHAEIHLVVQDHGMAYRNHKLRRVQLTQFHGACNPECHDIQFSVHK